MAIHLSAPRATELKPRIVVFGVGGAGGNAVNNMIEAGLEGVEFVVANTDAQQLQFAKTDRRIQLGVGVTQGLGAGAHPEVGMTAAEESIPEIMEHLEGAHMVFITAGMGGGTGTGAAPIIARLARERGILTVGVITKPFSFEGRHRMRLADSGIVELQRFVDTLIVIPNQNLFRIANERTTFAEAFGLADQVLHSGVRSITDLMVLPGLINLDFADVRAVMSDMGKAMMGTGEGVGEDRAIQAAQNAIANPLLDETSLKGAKAVLVNVTGGLDMTLLEVDEAANAISGEVDPEANIIFGAAFDPNLEGKLRVSVVATGMDNSSQQSQPIQTPSTTQAYGSARAPLASPTSRIEPGRIVPAASVVAPRSTPEPVRQEPVHSSTQIEDMFPAVSQAASAPVSPPATPISEAAVVAKIIDPAIEDGLDMPDLSPRAEPTISRPPYAQPAAPAQAEAPRPEVRSPQRPPASLDTPYGYSPPSNEDSRNSIWSVFRSRRAAAPPSDPYVSEPAPAPVKNPVPPPGQSTMSSGSSALDSAYHQAQSAAPSHNTDAEDDLEIPAFLRRLAN